MIFRLLQRALPVLCLILLISCSSTSYRQWEIEENITEISRFNAARLILGPDSDYSHLELELVRNSSGIRFYINLLFMQAPPCKTETSRTCISIQFPNQEPWIVYPYLLEGGQRLLLPGDIADILIQSLLDEQDFTIQLGRSQITVISTEFLKVYQQFLALSIEETSG